MMKTEILARNTAEDYSTSKDYHRRSEKYYGKSSDSGLIDVLNLVESEKIVDGGISISRRNIDDLLEERPDWVFETISRRISKNSFDAINPEERYVVLKLVNHLQTRRDYEKIRAIYQTVVGSWRSYIDSFLENATKLFGALSLTMSFGFDLIEWHLNKTGEYFKKKRAKCLRNKLRQL